MAISDVLFEARTSIEDWQRDGFYEGMEEELEVVKSIMANCQARLDVPEGGPKPILWADVLGAKRALEVLRRYEAVPAASVNICVRHGVAGEIARDLGEDE